MFVYWLPSFTNAKAVCDYQCDFLEMSFLHTRGGRDFILPNYLSLSLYLTTNHSLSVRRYKDLRKSDWRMTLRVFQGMTGPETSFPKITRQVFLHLCCLASGLRARRLAFRKRIGWLWVVQLKTAPNNQAVTTLRYSISIAFQYRSRTHIQLEISGPVTAGAQTAKAVSTIDLLHRTDWLFGGPLAPRRRRAAKGNENSL